MSERRRFVRISEHCPISYEVISGAQSAQFLTKDISQSGIKFYAHEFIPKNTFIRIRLKFQKAAFSFEAVTKVVRIEEDPRNDRYEVGVEFVNISKEASRHLLDYIKAALTANYQ